MLRKNPLRILVKRLGIFILTLNLAALGLWVTGNYRDYLDSTLDFLTRFLSYSAIVLGILSLAGVAIVLRFPAEAEGKAPLLRSPLLGILGYAFLLALASALALVGTSILTLSSGI